MITPKDIRVLIVDDNEFSAALAETELGNCGVGYCEIATSAISAIDRLKKNRFDVVLSDWYMPEINGAGLVHLIEWMDLDVPVVIMTAYATRENVRRFRQMNLKHVVIKPLERANLIRAIGGAITSKTAPSIDIDGPLERSLDD